MAFKEDFRSEWDVSINSNAIRDLVIEAVESRSHWCSGEYKCQRNFVTRYASVVVNLIELPEQNHEWAKDKTKAISDLWAKIKSVVDDEVAVFVNSISKDIYCE